MTIKEKYKGLSFAEVAEKIGKKYKDRDINAISQRSFQQEMNELKTLQEAYRVKQDLTGKAVSNDTNVPMAFNGLSLDPTKLISDSPLNFMNISQLNIDQGNKLFGSEASTPGIQNIQYPNNVTPLASTNKIKDNPYTPMAIGKGVEALGKGLMLAGGADKYEPITNPNKEEALNLMRNLGVNNEAARNEVIAQQEAAMANVGNVRSSAVQQALQQNILGQTADQLSRLELQKQGVRNQLGTQLASTLLQTGQQDVAAQERARQLNIASKAGYQQNVLNMLESIGATGQEVTEFKQGIANNEFVAKLIETGNFTLDPTCLKDFQMGKSVSSTCIKSKADDNTQVADRTQAFGNTDQKEPE